MKSLERIVEELREQIEEATDPNDPSKLTNYTASLRDGMEALCSMLDEDPTMAALALYGQVKFQDKALLASISEAGVLSKENWLLVKKTVLVRPQAHQAVKAIETAELHEVLVAAMLANFLLATHKRQKSGEKELEEIYEQV